MRSRSSRLFVVLLHLVGISNNLPNNPFKRVGIIGVHPLSILLEPLELQAAGGLGELLALLEGAGYDVDETVLDQPYWLQDDTDGTCLGPSGFSECGDATLWKIRRRPAIFTKESKRTKPNSQGEIEDEWQQGFLSFWGWDFKNEISSNRNENEWEYALELADVNSLSIGSENTKSSYEMSECVVSMPTSEDQAHEALHLGSCESDEAWSWSINEGGVLKWERNLSSIRAEKRSDFGFGMILGGPMSRLLDVASNDHIEEQSESRCLWKAADASATISSCRSGEGNANKKTLVSFSVIQYQQSAAVSPQLPRFPRNEEQDEESIFSSIIEDGDAFSSNTKSNYTASDSAGSSHLPKMKRSSKDNAAINDEHQSGIRTTGLKLKTAGHTSTVSSNKESATNMEEIISPLGVGGYFERTILDNKSQPGIHGNNILHRPPSPASSPVHEEIVHKPRKIPVHPYIEASKNGLYMDEITGMSYPTDISEYLGHDRKEVGRHTLTGVGIYTRTMLKIKVYGVAFYVSKRDVLNDSSFNDFAGMSSDELRESDDFYTHLMNMGSDPLGEGNFDRTLFIKLNMQLATETVRQSLTGDWKLLTDEHKEMLSSSSAREREADERMLETIQNEENTSNCSCGISAPAAYEADLTCCARGTEMVFTWRKNGDLELRIDGRLMDTFPHPEIGAGIFFEYLRGDDPMSMDARDRFADGFPFLLAPLAQLKGFLPKKETVSADTQSPEAKKPPKNLNIILGDIMDDINSRSEEVMKFIRGNLNGGVENLNNTFRSISTAAQNAGSNTKDLGMDIDKFREHIWSQIIQSHQASIRAIVSRLPFLRKRLLVDHLESNMSESERRETEIFSNQTQSNIFKPQIAKLLGDFNKQRPLSDEIGVIIEPTMNFTHMMFLYLVHFYLVLLLIVSVPDSSTTRLVVKRSSDSTLDSDSDHEERCKQLSIDYSCSEGMGPWSEVPDAIPRFVVEKNGVEQNNVDVLSATTGITEEHDEFSECTNNQPFKKSLSYFL